MGEEGGEQIMREEDLLPLLMRCIRVKEERGVDGRVGFSFTLEVGGSSISLCSSGDVHLKVGRHLIIEREGLSFDKCDASLVEEAILAYEEGEIEYDLFLMSKGISVGNEVKV